MTEEDKETNEEGISSTVAKKNIQFILGGQQQDSSLTCERKHSDPFGLTRSPFAAEPASTSSPSPTGCQPASTSSPSPSSISSGCQLVKDNVSKSASSIATERLTSGNGTEKSEKVTST